MRKTIFQESIINLLINSFKQNKLSHAYIFLGPEGVGKAFTAKYFAQFVNCENKDISPCFRCSNCIKIENGNHPDVHWVRPEDNSQGIKIEAIRNLQERVSLKPYEAKFKIFVIEKADFILEDAGNCLLKTLEEPPGNSLLILLAEERERFLPTIISRCQLVRFPLLKREIIEKFLQDNYHLDKIKTYFYSKLAEGSIGKAITLVNSHYINKRNLVLENFLKNKELGNELLWKEKRNFLEALSLLSGIFRDVLLEKFGLDNLIINIDQKDLIREITLLYSPKELYNLIDRFIFYYGFIQHNANLRLAFTNLEMDLERKTG
ncbi:MAG: DNA polymerase III subunit delta' [Candidatus Omnitrophica bacterium]|nr:DNA polymerase III subunit delta' [Candidatus Omnitrophota bacterium]